MTKKEKGSIIKGTVTGIENYGIFVSCDEFYSGLIHISEISNGFVSNIQNYVNIGDVINAKIIEVDEKNFHLKLSVKGIKYRRSNISKRKKIIETPKGFTTLKTKLPIWIEEKQKIKKTTNSLDK